MRQGHGRQTLALIPATRPGSPATQYAKGKRVLTSVPLPRYKLSSFVSADEINGVRAFATNNLETSLQEVVVRRLVGMRTWMQATMEFMRVKAIEGNITYPTGSEYADVNVFTLTGQTETEIDFELDDATVAVIEEKCDEVFGAMQAALGGTPLTGVIGLCEKAFFTDLISHAEIRKAYRDQQNLLATAGPVTRSRPYSRRVRIGEIDFVEYELKAASQISGQTFLAAGACRFVPTGTGMFQSISGPVDLNGAAGQMGQPLYVNIWEQPDNSGVNVELLTRTLHIPWRPKACVKGLA